MSETGYDETPETTARLLGEFARTDSSTSSAAAAARRPSTSTRSPTRCAASPPRKVPHRAHDRCALAGLEPLNIGDDSLFVNVGERTNVTGSKAFARLILAGDYAEALSVARQQVENGAQMIDVNMDEAMLDSKAAMVTLPEPDRLRARHRARAGDDRLLEVERDRGRPEVRAGQGHRQLDLAEGRRGRVPAPGAAGAPLRRRGGRDGLRREGPGRHATSARSRSASAPTTSWSSEVGFPPEDIIFDPNIFAIATGIEEHNNYAVDFIEATRWIKRQPAARQGLRRRLQRLVLASAATTRCARRSTPCSSTTRSRPA